MQKEKPTSKPVLWIAIASVIALTTATLIGIFVYAAEHAPTGAKPAAVSDQDINFAEALYNRNVQALALAGQASKYATKSEVKTIASQWTSNLQNENGNLKNWLAKNKVILKQGSSLPASLNLQPSEFRYAMSVGNGQDFRIATAMTDASVKIDLLSPHKVVSDHDLLAVLYRIQQLGKTTVASLRSVISAK